MTTLMFSWADIKMYALVDMMVQFHSLSYKHEHEKEFYTGS